MDNQLAVIETMSAVELFKAGALDPILEKIKTEVRAQASNLDIATETSRKEIASLAYKVARSKTFLDKQGKDLVAGEKKRLAEIDKERSRVWDELENLQTEVRKPLTDWENKDKARIALHEEVLAGVRALSVVEYPCTAESIRFQVEKIDSIDAFVHEEFSKRIANAMINTKAILMEKLAIAIKEETAKEEAEAAKIALAEQQRLARENEIAEQAKFKAENEARERERIAAITAETERVRIENEKYAAEARAKASDLARLAAIDRAKEDAKEAALRAAVEKKQAVEAEQARAKAESDRIEEEAKLREKDKTHKATVNKAALIAFIEFGLSEDMAKLAVTAIVKAMIPNVKISY